jgi:hypothetical protein
MNFHPTFPFSVRSTTLTRHRQQLYSFTSRNPGNLFCHLDIQRMSRPGSNNMSLNHHIRQIQITHKIQYFMPYALIGKTQFRWFHGYRLEHASVLIDYYAVIVSDTFSQTAPLEFFPVGTETKRPGWRNFSEKILFSKLQIIRLFLYERTIKIESV